MSTSPQFFIRVSLPVLCYIVLIAVAFCGPVGCASQKPYTAAELNSILNDKSLTSQQKDAEIAAITPDPNQQMYETSGYVLGISLLVLIGALIARKKAVDAIVASSTTPVKASASPVQKQNAKPISQSSKAVVNSSSPPKSAAKVNPMVAQLPNVKRLPVTQEEIDAIPIEKRGTSFFTSRPLPLDMLHEAQIYIGFEQTTVLATESELEECTAGNVPRIRALSFNGKTIPWYDWPTYDPYSHYVQLSSKDWLNLPSGVIACWIKAADLGNETVLPPSADITDEASDDGDDNVEQGSDNEMLGDSIMGEEPEEITLDEAAQSNPPQTYQDEPSTD